MKKPKDQYLVELIPSSKQVATPLIKKNYEKLEMSFNKIEDDEKEVQIDDFHEEEEE